jgi:phosphoribosylanthranilate isomerase
VKQIIQVAGVRDFAEAEMLVDAGVDWLGFPFVLPVNREDLSRAEAAQIVAKLRVLRASVSCVLITYLDTASKALELARELGADGIQFHGDVRVTELEQLKQSSSATYVIKSLVVRENNLDELKNKLAKYSNFVDAFITDTHDPISGADGATGKTHNWNISGELVRLSPKPLILAGGLNPMNVRGAILKVRPFGVDVHTGVENVHGRKDPELVKAFVENARNAFDAMT